MPVTVVVGGQFGSEGKGKVAHYFVREKRATVAIRVGGSNSGHTVLDASGRSHVFRMLPTAAVLDDVICVLGAGSYIDAEVLLGELEAVKLRPDRLFIDPNAYIVSKVHKQTEISWSLGDRIGSTQSGTGAAVVERIERISASHLASSDDRLSRFVRPVSAFLRVCLQRHQDVIIEGTQGFGLSLLHSPYYPKATSRDTTAAAFVSEAGLSPLDVDEIVLVIRAFPIRVAGDSGYLPNEIDWTTISREGEWSTELVELTSVTKKIRRVGRFSDDIVRRAIEVNRPTKLVLNHVDYFDAQSHQSGPVTSRVLRGIQHIEAQLDSRIDLFGFGPDVLRERAKIPELK